MPRLLVRQSYFEGVAQHAQWCRCGAYRITRELAPDGTTNFVCDKCKEAKEQRRLRYETRSKKFKREPEWQRLLREAGRE